MNLLIESLIVLESFYKGELVSYKHNNISESNLSGKHVF